MEFSEKQRLLALGDNATPVQVYYQRQLQISGGKGVPVQDLMSWSAFLPPDSLQFSVNLRDERMSDSVMIFLCIVVRSYKAKKLDDLCSSYDFSDIKNLKRSEKYTIHTPE